MSILLERDKAVIQEDEAQRAPKHQAVTSFEAEIFKRVIKENWKSKVSDENSKQIVAMLEEHASSMQKLLNNYEYEILSLPHVIASCKRMTRGEAARYLRVLEAIAVGYKQRYTPDMLSLLVCGLALKAKDAESAAKYLRLLTSDLEGKVTYYTTVSNAEARSIDNLALTLKYMEASLMHRIFKRGELVRIRRRIDVRIRRKRKFDHKRIRYDSVLSKVKGTANSHA